MTFVNEQGAREWARCMFAEHRTKNPTPLSDDAILEWLSDMARVGSENFPSVLDPQEREWVLSEYRSLMTPRAAMQYRGVRELRN